MFLDALETEIVNPDLILNINSLFDVLLNKKFQFFFESLEDLMKSSTKNEVQEDEENVSKIKKVKLDVNIESNFQNNWLNIQT